MFKVNTLPVIIKYLDKEKLQVKEIKTLKGEIVYRDSFQIVVDEPVESVKESSDFTPVFITQPQIPQGCVYLKDLEDGSAYFYDPETNMCMRTLSNLERKTLKD